MTLTTTLATYFVMYILELCLYQFCAMAIHLLRAPPLSLLTVVWSHTSSSYRLPVYKIAVITVRVLAIPN